MPKDLNGLEYPYYCVSAWVWFPDYRKENGGDYEYVTILETEDEAEAIKAFRNARVSADRLEVKIELVGEEESTFLNSKTAVEDGRPAYETDYGLKRKRK